MSQKTKQFDPVSIRKIKNGFVISSITACLAFFTTFSFEFTAWLQTRGDNPIDWFIIGLATWAAFSSGIINAGKEWLAGE